MVKFLKFCIIILHFTWYWCGNPFRINFSAPFCCLFTLTFHMLFWFWIGERFEFPSLTSSNPHAIFSFLCFLQILSYDLQILLCSLSNSSLCFSSYSSSYNPPYPRTCLACLFVCARLSSLSFNKASWTSLAYYFWLFPQFLMEDNQD